MPDRFSLSAKLLENKLISEDQYEKITLQYANTGKNEEEIIRDLGLVSEEDLVKTKGEIYNIPYIDLVEKAVVPEVIRLLPRSNAEYYRFFPFLIDKHTKRISIAFENPLDTAAVEFAEAKTGYKVEPYITTKEQLDRAINDNYTSDLVENITQAVKEVEESKSKQKIEEKVVVKYKQPVRREYINEIIDSILKYAIAYRASDVHIEPSESDTRVRYRIDGILHEKLSISRKVHDSLVSRIKILSDLKIDEKRIPQDGRFTFKANDQEVDLRVSTLPTVYGEKVVLRLLKKSMVVPTLDELGLRGLALNKLNEAILRPHGIILVCGPTGSGKTTTLYSILSKINSTKVNIITLEDPVEYKINGVNQVQVNPAAGLTFASGLRSFLRQDPNIIMVGEIRDTETADLAIQASLTGHLVFSTVHTKSASEAIPRLMDMGSEPFLLASTLTTLVAQRITRRVCQNCMESYEPPADVKQDIIGVLGNIMPKTLDDQLLLVKGKGCSECNNTGYYGRIGIFEVLPISEKIARLILTHAPAMDIEKAAIEEGMITMKQDGYLKVVQHVTTIEEVLRVAQD